MINLLNTNEALLMAGEEALMMTFAFYDWVYNEAN